MNRKSAVLVERRCSTIWEKVTVPCYTWPNKPNEPSVASITS